MSSVLSERKKTILKAVIEEYISSGEPVGSKFLASLDTISLSPATLRNEMAELTEMGYLAQPHTSAGRVPSEKGYRFYVDSLMQSYDLTASEMTSLQDMLRDKDCREESYARPQQPALLWEHPSKGHKCRHTYAVERYTYI